MKKLLFVAALIGGVVWFVSKNAGSDSPGAEAAEGTSPAATQAAPAAPNAQQAVSADNAAVAALKAPADDTAAKEDAMVAARDEIARLLLGELQLDMRRRLMQRLDEMNAVLVFSSMPTRYSTTRQVNSGDNLLGIGTETGQGVGLLMRMNGLSSPTNIRAGQTLKVLTGRTHIRVSKSQFTLSLFCGEQLIKQYLVGTGLNNCTPVGDFEIASKMRNPDWRGVPHDDPKNPLGTRWMGFAGDFRQYGIHGTREPEKIPSECSRGCVRMVNAQVEELMELVTYKAQVRITP